VDTAHRKLRGIVLLVFLLLPAARALAWLDTGHRIVALIVWDNLTPTTRAKVVEILKQHPRYRQDLLLNLPAETDEAAATEYAFSMAATWPDMLRSPGHPMHWLFNHPEWHWINLPYSVDGQAIPPTPAPAAPGPHDVVEALTKNVQDLKSADVSEPDTAIALCWVLHLGGDIHQPLHACSLYSPQFPNGDQGGHLEFVMRDPPDPKSVKNLHLIWDELPGDYKAMDAIRCMTTGLESNAKFNREQLTESLAIKDFAAWAQESHDLAIRYAYLDGKLKCASTQPSEDLQTPMPGLPKGYIDQSEQVALRRVVLAGYRTADLLNSIFDPR
jgi:S1/P1 nuclease